MLTVALVTFAASSYTYRRGVEAGREYGYAAGQNQLGLDLIAACAESESCQFTYEVMGTNYLVSIDGKPVLCRQNQGTGYC